MERVLDAFLASLRGVPPDSFVPLGATPEGQELRAGWHTDEATSADCVSVYVEVPEPPAGRLFVVLCRWGDTGETIAYSSVLEGADLPEWKTLELVPGGVRLSVKWEGEDAPRVYAFEWARPLDLPPTSA